MDITLTEEQTLISETAQAFAKNALTHRQIQALETDETGFDRGVWAKMAEMGWAGAPFHPDYGGSGLGLPELALIMEALGRGAVPSPIYSSVIEAGMLLMEAGSEAQRRHWLPQIAEGKALLTMAVAEAGGGLRAEETRTDVVKTAGGFRVSGTKLFVRDAGVAGSIICAGRDGKGGHTLVMVPSTARGLSRRRMWAAGGESLWEVGFDNVDVGADGLIGEAGKGWQAVDRMLQRCAALKAAEMVGIGQAAMELTVEYSKVRVQFGKPIGTFQAVQRHCAEMYRDITVTRLLAWSAAARLQSGRPALRESSMAKAKASDCIPNVTRAAHQVHGAFGYYREYPLELYYHRAYAAAATYGDARFHRRQLARLLREDMDAFRGDHRHDLPVPHH